MTWLVWMMSTFGLEPATEPRPRDGCVVTVVGLPVPARAHHELELAGGRTRLTNEGVQLRLEQFEYVVRLVGPRYTGELVLHPRACTGGTTHVLQARARRAVVTVEGPRALAMRCVDGPDGFVGKWWIARNLPPIDVGHGATLRCQFKSPGFRSLRRRVALVPGDNAIAVTMVALADAQAEDPFLPTD